MLQSQKLCIVFLIHAETTVREFIERVLYEHGSLVFSASNAQSGLQFLRSYRDDIHLVVLDYHLPGVNVIELADTITSERPHTHVVFTADSTPSDFPKHWRNRLLQKPLEAEVLRRQIETALKVVPCDTVPKEAPPSEVGA